MRARRAPFASPIGTIVLLSADSALAVGAPSASSAKHSGIAPPPRGCGQPERVRARLWRARGRLRPDHFDMEGHRQSDWYRTETFSLPRGPWLLVCLPPSAPQGSGELVVPQPVPMPRSGRIDRYRSQRPLDWRGLGEPVDSKVERRINEAVAGINYRAAPMRFFELG